MSQQVLWRFSPGAWWPIAGGLIPARILRSVLRAGAKSGGGGLKTKGSCAEIKASQAAPCRPPAARQLPGWADTAGGLLLHA